MSVPNHKDVPQKLYDTGLFDLTSEDGQGAFVDAVVACLHGRDERWGHLKKKHGQSQVHGHGEDSALYLSDDPGQSQAVDFIVGAGGSNPKPTWQVDAPRYSASDWEDPFEHGDDAVAPPATYPTYEELGGDSGGIAITRTLDYDYKRAGMKGIDADCGAWQQRVSYDFLTGKCKTVAESIAKHRDEWCQTLGINLP